MTRRKYPAGAPRLSGFDYASAGAYLITVCTTERRRILCEVRETGVKLTGVGAVVATELDALATRFHGATVDPSRAIMPDHVHAIIWIHTDCPSSLRTIVGLWKAGCTRECHRRGLIPDGRETIWQRSFFDRIVRTDRELIGIRRYILDNPRAWYERGAG